MKAFETSSQAELSRENVKEDCIEHFGYPRPLSINGTFPKP